ncbi:MAG: GNAT family N-acetyltransferase [Negativicutes bacterium]|nr:GNAT family N-acetyltransferase [Negativicutes bacterium]
MSQYVIRRISDTDRPKMSEFLQEHWGASKNVHSKGVLQTDTLPGFIVYQDGFIVGLITYDIRGEECELVTINSLLNKVGLGSSLLRSMEDAAREAGCKRIWLITTNDNVEALRFYQKRGFEFSNLYLNTIEPLRKLKPEIPLVGQDGILIKHELELQKLL